MLQQLKEIFFEHWPPARQPVHPEHLQEQLHIGGQIRFNLMEQQELSGKTLPITDSRTYVFSDTEFTSYALDCGTSVTCWLIVAEQEENTPYLALSRKASESDIKRLLTEDDIAALQQHSLQALYVREHTPGLKDWVTMKYIRKIHTLRGKRRQGTESRAFEYELYANEANNYAIEVERYLNGEMEVYLTVYRPASEIEKIITAPPAPPSAPPPAPRPVSLPEENDSGQGDRAQAPVEEASSDKVVPLQQPSPSVPQAKEQQATMAPPPPVATDKTTNKHSGKHSGKQKKQHSAGKDRLVCSVPTAARLLEEATGNNLRVSDVIRRIIGLPVGQHEQITINLSLSEQEWKKLAEHYGLKEQDKAAIQKAIVKELDRFAGQDTEF